MRQTVIALVDEATAAGARQSAACKELELSPRTLERWRREEDGGEDKRRGPLSEPRNKLTAEEREEALKVMNDPKYCDLSPNEVVPKLADEEGRYICSASTMQRILKQEKLNAHRGRAKEPTECQPVVRYATEPNQIWSWDIAYLRSPTRGVFFYLYLIVDIYSRNIMGWTVEEEENAVLAARLVRKAALAESVDIDELTLHSDNGGPMKGATLLATLEQLGIAPSFTRPGVPDDNPFSEALFRTVKYRPEYPERPFASIDEARKWVQDFVAWYNEEHLHTRIKYIKPADRHSGEEKAVLEARQALWEAAKAEHPERWGSRDTRNWEPAGRVCVRAKRRSSESGDLLQFELTEVAA